MRSKLVTQRATALLEAFQPVLVGRARGRPCVFHRFFIWTHVRFRKVRLARATTQDECHRLDGLSFRASKIPVAIGHLEEIQLYAFIGIRGKSSVFEENRPPRDRRRDEGQ